MSRFRLHMLAAVASLLLPFSLEAQTLNVHMKDGENYQFETEEVNFVDFSESSNPVGTTVQLLSGIEFNETIKHFVNPQATYVDTDTNIKKITFCKGMPAGGTLVSNAGSDCEARALYDASTQEVTIYTDAENIAFPETCEYMFCKFSNLTCIDWSDFDKHLNTSNTTSMSAMFFFDEALTELDVSWFDTSLVTDMSLMFRGCATLTELDITSFDTHLVRNMYGMLSDCTNLRSLDLSHFDTRCLENMNSMFVLDKELVHIDLSHFDTSNVYMMNSLYSQCSKLSSIYLGKNFVIGETTSMGRAFSGLASKVNSCTITCTEETKAMILQKDSTLDEKNVCWNIIE